MQDSNLAEAVEAAVTPTPAELLSARQLFLQALSANSSCVVSEMETLWLTSVGGRPPISYSRDERPLVERAQGGGYQLIDRADDRLLVEKARRIAAVTLSDLAADGLIVQSIGDNYRTPTRYISIPYAGGADGLEIPDEIPKPMDGQARVKLRHGGAIFDAILNTDDYLAGLGDLLGVRADRAIREARAAMRQGLYLAGASLLAAASEAAWFNLGRAVPGPTPALEKSLESGRDPAQVVEAVAKYAQDNRLLTATQLNEIRADAHHLRDIRNYSLHPVSMLDADREAWLSEAGCATLLISSRRYFVRLAELLVQVRRLGEPAP